MAPIPAQGFLVTARSAKTAKTANRGRETSGFFAHFELYSVNDRKREANRKRASIGKPAVPDHSLSVASVSQSASTIMKSTASPEQISQIIRYAWEDRTTFEQIKERAGFTEKQVIDLMARELKPSSFRLWRKRVCGRITKHRKLLEKHLKGPIDEE